MGEKSCGKVQEEDVATKKTILMEQRIYIIQKLAYVSYSQLRKGKQNI